MDKDQAKAIADSILEPDLREQEARTSRSFTIKAAAATNRRRGRIALLCMFVGTGIGGATAYFTGSRLTSGFYWGLIVGGLVGWGVAYVRVRTAA